jgi:hypothetical protein
MKKAKKSKEIVGHSPKGAWVPQDTSGKKDWKPMKTRLNMSQEELRKSIIDQWDELVRQYNSQCSELIRELAGRFTALERKAWQIENSDPYKDLVERVDKLESKMNAIRRGLAIAAAKE